MSIILDDLRGMAQSGVPLCDLAADEIESLEQAYELLFKENAKLRAQADQQAQPVAWMKVSTYITPDSPNGPAEYDQEVELVLDGELASYEGYIPLFTSPPAQPAREITQDVE